MNQKQMKMTMGMKNRRKSNEIKKFVGRKAIRTGEMVRSVFDLQRHCMVPNRPTPTQIAKYTDKPVTVIAVEGCQIVIEESNGERKLLPREYDDDFWTDYEKLMHPEEERQRKRSPS